VIPLARIREALYAGQDFGSIAQSLPGAGVVLSAEEVAQVRAALEEARSETGRQEYAEMYTAALALLDGADEEEEK